MKTRVMRPYLLLVNLSLLMNSVVSDNIESSGYCYTHYVHVSVVKQVPSYSKHCTKVILLLPMIIYRMVIVEGRCDQLTLSSLHTYIIIGWHKSIVSSDWSDTMVWFGQILLLLSFTILYIISLDKLDKVSHLLKPRN